MAAPLLFKSVFKRYYPCCIKCANKLLHYLEVKWFACPKLIFCVASQMLNPIASTSSTNCFWRKTDNYVQLSLSVPAAHLPSLAVICFVHPETLFQVLRSNLGVHYLFTHRAWEPASFLIMQTLPKYPTWMGGKEGGNRQTKQQKACP